MMPLAEAVQQMACRHLLTGSLEGDSELLQFWIYRRESGFDLFVGSTSTANHPRPHRNIVSRGFETPQELLEALGALDQIYRVSAKDLLSVPTALQTAIPEQMDALARQLQLAGQQTKNPTNPGSKVDLSALEARAEQQALLDDDDVQVLAD